jgi:hypothetical protein
MLRYGAALVLALNVALAGTIWAVNTGRWAWPEAWRGEAHEPERMARQLNGEAIVLKAATPALLPPALPASAPALAASAAVAALAAPAKTLCLLSAVNEAARATELRAALALAAPNATVQSLNSTEGGTWMVYMGRYSDNAVANNKFAELNKLKLKGDYEIIRDAASFQPGISLGVFRERERAAVRLAEVKKKGVNSAKVVARSQARELTALKLPELEAGLRDKANEALLKAGGKPLEACPSA